VKHVNNSQPFFAWAVTRDHPETAEETEIYVFLLDKTVYVCDNRLEDRYFRTVLTYVGICDGENSSGNDIIN